MVGIRNITSGFAGGRNFGDQPSSATNNQNDIGSTIDPDTTTSQNHPSSATDSIINTAQNSHSTATHNSIPTVTDDSDGLHAAMSASPGGVDKPSHKYSDSEMEQYATMKLTSLCAAGNTLAISRRMTQEMKEELDDLYYDQQSDIVRLAIQHRAPPHLFFAHLGMTRRIRGDTSWNNFQHKDPEALKLRAELGKEEGGAQVSLAWASKSKEEKARYRDRDYLQTLRQGSSNDGTPNASDPVDDLNANLLYEKEKAADWQKGVVQVSKVSLKKTSAMVTNWVKKVQQDLDSMAFNNQVEGFFVVASRHPKSTIFQKGGSTFGNGFMDMVSKTADTDFAAEFHTWVAAQAIQLSKGCTVWLPRKTRIKPSGDARDEFNVGTRGQNITAIREKLKKMISTASGKKVNCGWPGENTETRLRQLKLSLTIDDNKWSVVPKDIMKVLDHLKDGVDRAVLACLGLNKIHLTYHADWDDIPSTCKKSIKRKKPKDTSASTQEEPGNQELSRGDSGGQNGGNTNDMEEQRGPDGTGAGERMAASTRQKSVNADNEEEVQSEDVGDNRPTKRARVVVAKRKHSRKDTPATNQKRPAKQISSTRQTPTGGENGQSTEVSADTLDPMLNFLR
ncbi:hypothetical protein MJO29_014801 [Puccinia striiformis f. sp. tritici]|nr:hypothetical protein MJO29_014801 [Puccinia striiformis f. sp. tritici]